MTGISPANCHLTVLSNLLFLLSELTERGALGRPVSWDYLIVLTGRLVTSLLDMASWTSEGYLHSVFYR